VRVLAYSLNDLAGKGIADFLRGELRVKEVHIKGTARAYVVDELDAVLAGFEDDVIYFDFLDDVFSDAELYVVLSRHSATSGVKSLTTHHTGNPLGSAVAGGRPYELSVSNPPLAKMFLALLRGFRDEYGLTEFSVTYEVTHHGPTNLRRPLTFIEIGSTEVEWSMKKAHEVVGMAVIQALKGFKGCSCVPTVGFGGPHYATPFTERALKSGECYGHIISRYALRDLKRDRGLLARVVRDSIVKSSVETRKAVVLRKAGRVVRDVVTEVAGEYGVEVEVM